VVNGPIGAVTGIFKFFPRLFTADWDGMERDWAPVAKSVPKLLKGVVAPAARITGIVFTGGFSEIAPAVASVGKAGFKAFGISDNYFFSCLLTIPDADFDELIYLYDYKNLYDSLSTSALTLDEPSRIALALQILAKYGEKNPDSTEAVASTLVSLGTSIAGIAGVPLGVFPEFAGVTASAVGKTAKFAEDALTNFNKEHPEQKTAVQRRIARYLEGKDPPAFLPSADMPEPIVQLAGAALGPYFCQARERFGQPITDGSCQTSALLFDTFKKDFNKWAKLHENLKNPFAYSALLQQGAQKHTLRQKLHKKVHKKNNKV
jgi:hypothetical protein